MLRDIKQKSTGLFAKFVMAILIIAFVFWGVGSSLISAGNDSAATVNGEKITIADFNQAFQASKNRLTQQFGDNVGAEYFESANFKKGVMNQLVNSTLLKQEASKFDFDVSPTKIREYIQSSPGLQIDGKFSKEAYANFLAQSNKSAELLQRDIKEDLKSSALPKMITQSAFVLDNEVKKQYALTKQTRSFNYIEVKSDDYLDKVKVTDDEINNHYKEFGDNYMTDEKVSVKYIELSTKDLLDEVELTEDEITTYYNAKKDTLLTSEKRKAQHILLPVAGDADKVKIEIDKVAARIKAGENFDEVAKVVSQDPGSAKKGGDLGWVSKGDMVEAFENTLFSMQTGEVSEPVLSKFGYHIIKLNEVKSPEVPTLDSIKETLVEELKLEKIEELFLTKADELSTQIVDADNVLEIAAENSGLEIKTTQLFAKGRGLGLASNANFSTIAFTDAIIGDNEVSEMIDLGENHIAYLQLADHKDSVIKALAEVKVQIENKLKTEKAIDKVKETVSNLVKQVKSGDKTLVQVAAELGKTVVGAKDINRTGSKQPYNLVKNVFSLSQNNDTKNIFDVGSANNVSAIVELLTISNAKTEELKDDDKETIASQIQRAVSNSEISVMTEYLRDESSININESIFEDPNQ